MIRARPERIPAHLGRRFVGASFCNPLRSPLTSPFLSPRNDTPVSPNCHLLRCATLRVHRHAPPFPVHKRKLAREIKISLIASISGDRLRAVILSHPPTHLKRDREDDEEKAAWIEGLPTRKRRRPDNFRCLPVPYFPSHGRYHRLGL